MEQCSEYKITRKFFQYEVQRLITSRWNIKYKD